MKPFIHLNARLLLLLACSVSASGQSGQYTHFIRQVNLPEGVTWDRQVAAQGSDVTSVGVGSGGARFELWSVSTSPLISYLVDTTVVSAYLPTATVAIQSEDPYAAFPRTRADRGFQVHVTVAGLLSGESDPEPSKSVNFLRFVQSYGTGGTGAGIDRSQATLLSQAPISTNGSHTFTYAINAVPGADRAKVRGEETFKVFSNGDYNMPPLEIDSKIIQIWPVASASISGITHGQVISSTVPPVTITLNDLYPDSRTYAQVYRGSPQLGTAGTVIPGSSLLIKDSVPSNRIMSLSSLDALIHSNGLWTMELLTQTPFGTDRLAAVSFAIEGHDRLQSLVMVKGNDTLIADGDSSPSSGDDTDFGTAPMDGDPLIRTYTIQNTGSSPLVLIGNPIVAISGAHASDFTLTQHPASTLPVGTSTSFQISFSPSAGSLRSATIGIDLGAPIGNTFDFAIHGSGPTRENWRLTHFGQPENSGDGADLYDFDHDGIANLIEYAFGLDPKNNSAGLLPTPQRVGGDQVIAFTRPIHVGDVTYGAEWSTSLAADSWQPIPNSAVLPEHSFSVPVSAKPKLYMRLKVTSP